MSGQARRKRHSPAVYRRRRLVLLVGLVLVVGAIVWLVVAQPWRGEADASPPRTPSPSVFEPAPDPTAGTPSTDPTDETDPAASDAVDPAATSTPEPTDTIKPCVPANLRVEALTDSDSYRSGQNPQLSIRLTNTGSQGCTLNVGTTNQRFTITSGGDTWWRSTDCQAEPVDMIVTLEAGQIVTSATPLTWDRTRSSVSTCGDSTRPRAPGGGASYHLTVEIGGVESMGSKQFLLY